MLYSTEYSALPMLVEQSEVLLLGKVLVYVSLACFGKLLSRLVQ
jgi:hypothetical protein